MSADGRCPECASVDLWRPVAPYVVQTLYDGPQVAAPTVCVTCRARWIELYHWHHDETDERPEPAPLFPGKVTGSEAPE